MEGKVWQEYQIRVLCERLHILCVHASLHEQAHNCACVNFNVCERRDKERQIQKSDKDEKKAIIVAILSVQSGNTASPSWAPSCSAPTRLQIIKMSPANTMLTLKTACMRCEGNFKDCSCCARRELCMCMYQVQAMTLVYQVITWSSEPDLQHIDNNWALYHDITPPPSSAGSSLQFLSVLQKEVLVCRFQPQIQVSGSWWNYKCACNSGVRNVCVAQVLMMTDSLSLALSLPKVEAVSVRCSYLPSGL